MTVAPHVGSAARRRVQRARVWWGWLVALSPALAVRAGAAEAATPLPEAALVHIDCAKPRLDADQLYESLALELKAQGITLRPLDALEGDDNFVLEVRTDCDTRQQLVLRAARGVRSTEVRFSLADVPHSSEPRTVALALAELLEDFRAHGEVGTAPIDTPATTDKPQTAATKPALNSAVGPSLDLGPEVDNAFRGEPAVTIRDVPPPEPAPDPGVHLMGHLGVEQRTFRLSNSLTGLSAGFTLERAELGASLLRGAPTSPTDRDLTEVVANLALGYRVAEVTNGRWTASITPRVGFGNLVLTAPADPDSRQPASSATDLYGDIAARVSVHARLWSRLGLTLNSEAGYGRGLVSIADGPPTSDYTGLFLGVALLGSVDVGSRKNSRVWPPVRTEPE